MLFTTLSFAVFLGAVCLACLIVPARFRWLCLLVASLGFYATFGAARVGYVLVASLISWGGARWSEAMARQSGAEGSRHPALKKRGPLLLSMGALLFMLLALKYAQMFLPAAASWVAPLGISFYTLSAIGYLIDVYRGKSAAERNPLRMLLFLSCFLQIVQGPFVRYERYGQALNGRSGVSYDGVKLGAMRMMWGYFKKMAIADQLSAYISSALGAPCDGNGVTTLLAILFYTIQIYADFSGYMDIVVGAGQTLGMELPENFANPLAARSVSDFWRRWHMTLGAWFKDYVFYPVSISRPSARLAKRLRKHQKARLARITPAIMALCVVWPLTGLWHGASLNFLVWGSLNGLTIIVSMFLEPKYEKWRGARRILQKSRAWSAFQIIRTFLLLSLIRVFSYSATMPEALEIFSALFHYDNFELSSLGAYFPPMSYQAVVYHMAALALTPIMLLVEAKATPAQWLQRFQNWSLPLKYAAFIALLYAVLLLGSSQGDLFAGFLYARF